MREAIEEALELLTARHIFLQNKRMRTLRYGGPMPSLSRDIEDHYKRTLLVHLLDALERSNVS